MSQDSRIPSGRFHGWGDCVGAFGAAILAWMVAFPPAVLAIFLLQAGVCLARVSRFREHVPGLTVCTVTVVIYFATGYLPLAFLAGWVTHFVPGRMKKQAFTVMIKGACS